VASLVTFELTVQKQAAIIPKEELFTYGLDVGARFFQLTLGRAGVSNRQLQKIWPAFKAISALGNLIVTTFTAARGSGIRSTFPQWQLTLEQ